jgi:two-component system, cell cycle response regulator
MIDLDHFKSLNDTYGHPAGDEVLKAVAQTITKTMRGRGSVYRYGGEEISIILPNHSLGEAIATAERIRNEITTISLSSVEKRTVTASLGVATVPDTSKTITNLVKDADRALYEAKESGRNRACSALNEDAPKITQHKWPDM